MPRPENIAPKDPFDDTRMCPVYHIRSGKNNIFQAPKVFPFDKTERLGETNKLQRGTTQSTFQD